MVAAIRDRAASWSELADFSVPMATDGEMGQYTAVIEWERNGAVFRDQRYSRGHLWQFDGGIEVRASASPHHVPLPLSVAEAVDPEEAFVAALASCHMLWFLSIAARQGFLVESYRDEAAGVMGKNADGRLAITQVTLRPRVVFGGEKRPTPAEHEAMHHEAHEECFLASSVKTDVRCRPVAVTAE
jgi:organic hydroperoxide reductase OsmC/OhrA